MQVLTEQELVTLRAAVNRLIPADEFPSGWESGVGDYIQMQLSGQLSDLMTTYQAGLSGIEAEAQGHFSELSEERQDALLSQIEMGNVTTSWATDPKQFFQLIVNHSGEGFYGNPENGGNRDCISWKMIGFEVTS